jgi:hypothetical protein
MLMEKMRRGVLQVSTDSGVRYVQPSFSERLQLLWTFRNFNVLSEEVLNEHEKQILHGLCTDDRLFRPHITDCLTVCVIGTVECSHSLPARRAPQRAMHAVQRSA